MRHTPAILALVFLIGGCNRSSTPDIAGRGPTFVSGSLSGTLDRPIPDFEAVTLEGDTLRSSDLLGSISIINFWATWCGPCIVETPELVGLQEEWKDRPFRVVGVSQDEGGFEDVRPFVEDFEVNYPQILDHGPIGEAFGGVVGLPTSFLVDSEGEIRHRFVGIIPFDVVRPQLDALLTELEARTTGNPNR